MIDSHTHLDAFDDAGDRLAAALARGVTGVVSVGCGASSIERTLQLARAHADRVRVVGGVHPQAAASFAAGDWTQIEALLDDPLVVGVGETGFDYFRDHGPRGAQDPLFELHADLARRRNLPLVIHTRAADRQTLDALARHADGLRVLLHCFSMTECVDEVIERGYWCSFAGNVTYKNAEDLRAAAARIPDERLLVETDAPYLAPVPHRGTRNEPAHVADTAACIARVRGLTVAEIDALTTRNTVELFALPPSMSAA